MREFEHLSDAALDRLSLAVVRAVLYGAKLDKDTRGEVVLLDELNAETATRRKAVTATA